MNLYAAATMLNLIDVLMAVVIATVLFAGRKEGLIAGLFKLFGVVCLVFISLHYYVHVADYLRAKIFGKETSTEFLAFTLLAIPTLVVFIIICKGWVLILHVKFFDFIDKWGGILCALVRSYLLCGLIFFGLILSEHKVATPQAYRSVSRLIFGRVAVSLYEKTYTSLVAKFFPGEKINEAVFALVDQEPKKKDKK